MEMVKNQLDDIKKDLQGQTKGEKGGNKKKSAKPTPEIIKSNVENKENTNSNKDKKAVGKVGGRRKKK
jgi:hypothetical protein